ncbi:AAA-domain-containing protein [Laetiporus sulphureus 93-53]|uniref:Peroxisomal ATPase PEX6 n=1 Tax=Laetiporus sulphureus 93-53 TaxID=1314785 RepID=A0A165CTV1_9APHY|nr:AAA-domain-containing protein [Laetiporus sulphureus 93-53]KZT03423.1 AAA-domain-containing protein [Laetiporus sulphureus 93-53]
MDYLFGRPQVVPCSFSLSDPGDDNDILLVPRSIWEKLSSSHRGAGALAVSVTRIAPHVSYNESPLHSFVCWVSLSEDVSRCAIPPRWLHEFPQVFTNNDVNAADTPTHHITAVRPVALTEVIVAALSDDAYTFAELNKAALEARLLDKQAILRQGSIYSVPRDDSALVDGEGSQGDAYMYQLVMVAPVLQGCAEKGFTRFYVTLATQPALPLNLPLASSNGVDGISDTSSTTSREEELEIDESFLAGSVLQSMPDLASLSHYRVTGGGPLTNGDQANVETKDRPKIQLPEWACSAKPLPEPISLEQDDCTIYVSTPDLSHIGILNGDWAVVRSKGSTSYRLVRVCAADSIEAKPGTATLSPQLLHNIAGGASSLDTPFMCLRSSPFGSLRPAIPTARSVTIARIASFLSTDRTYQSLFLRALQAYFEETTRLVKKGDVIAVTIDTDHAIQMGGDDEGEMGGYDYESENVNEVIYFVVTNLEHNIVTNAEASSPDMYLGSTMGELGCWVDPTQTRMIQTGVEYSRVPDVSQYLSIEKPNTFSRSRHPVSTLLDPDSAFGKLLALSSAALNRHAVDYQLQLSIVLKGSNGVGKRTVATAVAQRLGMHIFEVNCYDVLGENDVKTEGTLRARFERAASCSPCILLLRNIDAFARSTQSLEPGKESSVGDVLQDCIATLQQAWGLTGFPIIVVSTTSNAERVPPRVLSCFKHEIVFEAPGEAERYDILMALLHDCNLGPDVSIRETAVQTAALVAADLVDLISRAQSASMQRAMRTSKRREIDLFNAGIPIVAADFDAALAESRASYSENIGAPKIPSVTWDDVGGLAHVKADILDTIQLPLEHPELFADGLKKRSGILLYGPPGTGKTLLAKAVATSCALNFFSVKGPELLNMYIGESEANVRRVFQRARDARPCVVFFDELDSVAPKRGSHGDSGGVMDRIVSQILAELDGLSGGNAGGDVFVIGATNRPDLLDPALLRPGRFDRMLYLGISKSHVAQLNILQALTRKFRLHPDLRLENVAEQCPFHYTGADFYALCADALLKAMARKAEELEAAIAILNANPPANSPHPYPLTPQYYLAELATPAEMEVLVSHADFDAALSELIPSVSQAEMEHYARIQQRFSQETINTTS